MSASSHTITVALAGNPNSGKTTVFNGLTGARQRIGNWPGVTVEKKEGFLNYESATDLLVRPFAPDQGHTTEPHKATAQLAGGRINIVDLPGIYSLSATAEDEIIARDYLLSGEADVVVDIVDATNLQRNLYLTLQLIEMEIPVVVVLNMMDIAQQRGLKIDADELSERLGCPVVPASAIRSDSIQNIKRSIAHAAHAPAPATVEVSYPEPIEALLSSWEPRLSGVSEALHVRPRWIALKILEHDSWITDRVVASGALGLREIADSLEALDKQLGDDADIAIADAKYALIHGLSRQVSKQRLTKEALSDRIDRIALNRILGIPIFLGVMYLVFWVSITVGGAFIDFFDILFGTIFVDGLGALIAGVGAPAWLQTIVAGGLGAGVQTVATFIPVMFFMFLVLALLEDSGYMARAAFVMDRFMRRIGLPGKSFVPMMVGFGCTIPAILGTRTLESTKDRYMTIFMAPFMSCGARLPVYALFAAAFFPTQGGLVVFSLYLIGIILAMLTGLLLKHTMFRGETSHFIMELPPYHSPRPRQTLLQTWSRLKSFIVRAGTVIVLVVMLLSVINSIGTDGTFGNEDTEQSVLSATGRAITPVFTPMGIEKDNWPATVGIFTGLFAKEVIVGTLSSLY
ncbi:MAG: ferrous iron transport protein B, partial [Spirochaetaceae bacterium]